MALVFRRVSLISGSGSGIQIQISKPKYIINRLKMQIYQIILVSPCHFISRSGKYNWIYKYKYKTSENTNTMLRAPLYIGIQQVQLSCGFHSIRGLTFAARKVQMCKHEGTYTTNISHVYIRRNMKLIPHIPDIFHSIRRSTLAALNGEKS